MTKEQALEFLSRLAQAIALMFGGNCEVLVHEMHGSRIVTAAIFNGHVSGRTVGSTLSIYGKDTAADDEVEFDLEADYLNQLVVTPSGKNLKSTTVHFRGPDYHYALGINYDITVMNRLQKLRPSTNIFSSSSRSSLVSILLVSRIYVAFIFRKAIFSLSFAIPVSTRPEPLSGCCRLVSL